MAKVFIGVGHGGSDPGAVSHLVEKDVNICCLVCLATQNRPLSKPSRALKIVKGTNQIKL